MKNKWYRSNKTKGVWIILCHMGVIAIALCMAWMICYPAITEEFFSNDKRGKVYEDSLGFYRNLLTDADHLTETIQYKDLFETKGVYDPDKIVDIEKFYKEEKVSKGKEGALRYRLGDLIEWGKDIQTEDSESRSDGNEDGIVVCKAANGVYTYYFLPEFKELVLSKKLQFIVANDEDTKSLSTADILRRMEEGDFYEGEEEYFKGIQDEKGRILYINCWCYDGELLKEAYAPLDASNLLEVVNENMAWNGRLSEAIQEVASVVDELRWKYQTYESLGKGLEEGETNFWYLYVDKKNEKIFTNRKDLKGYENLSSHLKKYKEIGKYVIIDSDQKKVDTNISSRWDMQEWSEGQRTLINGNAKKQKEFVYAMGVDTAYPVEDVFFREAKNYSEHATEIVPVFLLGIAGTILFFVGMIWLVLVSGRKPEDEELYLMGFDRVKTELAAILVFGTWGLIIGVCVLFAEGVLMNLNQSQFEAGSYVSRPVAFFALVTVMAIFTCAFYLIGLLSLARRVKGRTIWKNSVLRSLCKWSFLVCKKCYHIIKIVVLRLSDLWRIVLGYGIFLFIQWLAMGTQSGGVVILSLLADGIFFVYLIRRILGMIRLQKGVEKICQGELNEKIDTDGLVPEQEKLAEGINSIGDGLGAAVSKSLKSERLKTDLITNVSHDIKTPLTSIINYVDLLKKEEFEDPKIAHYIEVLEQKSQRLKVLTEDIVEASKVSSGNISLVYMNLNLVEFIQQVSGEFEERFAARNLQEIRNLPKEEVLIYADGRRLFRVLENLYRNIEKYAMEGSRVYTDLKIEQQKVVFSLKNISSQPLNISADELTERFIRGDISRSTEGSGLGLSIAKSLVEIQGGTFELYLDGDLFKVMIQFDRM